MGRRSLWIDDRRGRAAWAKRQFLKLAVCVAAGVGVTAIGLASSAWGRDSGVVTLVSQPAGMVLEALGEGITDRLSERGLVFLGLAGAAAVWTLVALAVWHVTAFALRLAFKRSAR
ncbi:MAG: hypothetical protein ABW221_06165 [Vicinamibacteria bacterium]